MQYAFLKTDHLQVGYKGKPLISEICLSVQRGEILTLIGPNGAGKSTILKSIARQLALIGGKVLLDGKDMGTQSLKETARRMSVMLTDRTKPELMTCHDIVAAGRYPYTGALGILSETDEKAIEDALELVHAREIAFRDFNAISDGQRQRVLLARALCQEPEIIVLDEPTSFLDIRHKLELLEILRHMAREQNITVILSLHEIDLAQKISDRVVCVKGDRIAGYGSAEEIFTEEKIRNLYELREGVYDPAFGSLELPGTEGDPRVFVLSGCGTGIPVFRSLKRQGIPFAAGILYTNDIDYRLARLTAAEVVSEQPFEEISDRALTQARQWVDRCGSVIVTEFPIRSVNHRIEELIGYVKGNPEISYRIYEKNTFI